MQSNRRRVVLIGKTNDKNRKVDPPSYARLVHHRRAETLSGPHALILLRAVPTIGHVLQALEDTNPNILEAYAAHQSSADSLSRGSFDSVLSVEREGEKGKKGTALTGEPSRSEMIKHFFHTSTLLGFAPLFE